MLFGMPSLHLFTFLTPYLQHKPWQQLATMPAVLNSRFHVCTSHAFRPMTVVFGLGTRLRVRMHTTFKNGVQRNGQQPSRAENSFINQGKALRCDGGEYLDRFRDIDVELCGLKKKEEKWHLRNHTLLHLTIFQLAFGHLCESS